MIAVLFAQMPNGGDRKFDQKRKSATDLSTDAAAELLNVGKDVVKDARVVLNTGACELTEVTAPTMSQIVASFDAENRDMVGEGP